MMNDVIVGGIVVFAALGLITYLALRSRRTIELIHRKKLDSTREIIKTINGNG